MLCRNAEASPSLPVTDATLLRDTDIPSRSLHRLLSSLQRAGHITRQADGVLLTEHGRHEANKVLRSHRLWEAYLVDVANVRADHTHASPIAWSMFPASPMQWPVRFAIPRSILSTSPSRPPAAHASALSRPLLGVVSRSMVRLRLVSSRTS